MAIKTQALKKSNRIFLNLLILVFLGWIILLARSFWLWGFSGFDTAWQSMDKLVKKQRSALAEFNDDSLAHYLKSWLAILPTQELTRKFKQASQLIQNQLSTLKLDERQNLVKELMIRTQQSGLLINLSLQVMGIKLIILLAAIPLFVLSLTVGLVDGLNQRAIRTTSLGRESSFIFHQLHRYFKRGLLVLIALWLVIPLSISPVLLFIPVSILLSIMVSITISHFKKYV